VELFVKKVVKVISIDTVADNLEETNYSLLSPVQMFLERLQSVSVLADVDVLDEDDDVVGVFLRGLVSVLRVSQKVDREASCLAVVRPARKRRLLVLPAAAAVRRLLFISSNHLLGFFSGQSEFFCWGAV